MKKTLKIGWVVILIIMGGVFLLYAAGKPRVTADLERLGMHLYKDKNLSLNQNQSCQTCHHPLAGFADRSNFLHPYDKVVSLGSDGVSLGGRNAPSSAYAGYSPIRYQDSISGEWFGGMFWDGRATGTTLGDPLAEQAQGPPLNPVEMAMPGIAAVMDVIIPTLRNIAVTAPYAHNGVFPTLYDMVSFINDSTGFVPDVGGDNVSTAVGNLGLSEAQIDDLIAFLHTLTDDY